MKKKFNLEHFYKNLLMISGSMTIIIGIVNQLKEVVEGYTKKAREVYDESVHVMARAIHHGFFQDNWQVLMIGVGIMLLVIGLIISHKIKKRG
jgi:hypothetical protein